jgi:uncharacterized protein
MGAIGVARCFAFGGRTNNTLFGPPAEPRAPAEPRTPAAPHYATDHFHTKLLHLEKYLQTKKGRVIGAKRQKSMAAYLKSLELELVENSINK